MKRYKHAMMIASLAALMSTSALADANHAVDISTIKTLKTGDHVNLSGSVDNIKNEREFTLRDKTGTMDVNIASNESVVLKQGDTVNVAGTVDSGFFSTAVNASQVDVRKGIVNAVSDAIEGNTKISLEGANSYDINSLPAQGLVKISGTVKDVDNEKKFTLQDQTGTIDIKVGSAEKAALTEGARVTVIGYVDDGMMGKDINAKKILVVADSDQ